MRVRYRRSAIVKLLIVLVFACVLIPLLLYKPDHSKEEALLAERRKKVMIKHDQ